MHITALLISFLSLNLFANESQRIPKTHKVDEYIDFNDDLDFENMKLAIKRHMVFFNRADLNVSFKFGAEQYSRHDLKNTLVNFEALIDMALECMKNSSKNLCYDQFSKQVNNNFNIYKPVPESWENGFKSNQSLFTAYYSPDFYGSRTKTDVYKNPI
jgi:hypothetical protein